MSAELIKLPNIDLKIQRQNVNFVPDFLYFPVSELQKLIYSNRSSEDIDILIILFHLYLTRKQKDGLLYINTDDILCLRSIKQNKSGYKKEVRKRIDTKVKNPLNKDIYTLVDYKEFNYILDFKDYQDATIIDIDKKLLALNPHKKSWHKTIGLYLTILKNTSNSNCTVQIKKLLNITPPAPSLFPFQIRQRFEDALDELNSIGIFKGWHYKNIDEEALNSKNWLYFWKLLSIKIKF